MIYGAVLIILTMFGLVIESILPNAIQLAGATPDLLLLLVVFNGMFRGLIHGGAAGFAIGLLEDLFMGRFIGLNALAKALVGATAGYLSKSIFKENLWVPVLNVGWGSLLNLTLIYLVGRLVGNQWSWGLVFWQSVFEIIYNVCLVPFLYIPFFNFADKQLKLIDKD